MTVPEPEFYFVVWFKDGRKSVTHLREKPMLKYDSEVYMLATSTTETRFAAADVAKITLADNPDGNSSGINDITDDEENAPRIQAFDIDTMVISGNNPGAIAKVFTVSGISVATYKADASGVIVISLSDLPQGLLIIQTEKITYKIIKK